MRRVVTQTYYSVLFISLFGLGGCLQVVSPVVVGTKVVSVELEEWEGSWRGPDDVEVSLEVINRNDGVVALSWSEVIDGEETFNRSRAYFRSMSGVLFVSVEMPLDDDGNTGYLWGKGGEAR